MLKVFAEPAWMIRVMARTRNTPISNRLRMTATLDEPRMPR